jgi:hypothetical protein
LNSLVTRCLTKLAGEPLTALFAWRVSQPLDRDYSFYVHLVEPGGRVVGQSDHTVPTTRYTVGDVVVERFFIAPLVDTRQETMD